MGLYLSALIQAGDILMPQLPEFGGPEAGPRPRRRGPGPAHQAREGPRERLPQGLRVHPSLRRSTTSSSRAWTAATKMSKRSAASSFTLNEDPSSAAKKVMAGFTGGRASVEEQRKHRRGGGQVPHLRPLPLPLRDRGRVREEGLRRVLRGSQDVRRLQEGARDASSSVTSRSTRRSATR